MPPQFLFDLSTIDLNKILFDQDAIRQANPQRGDMEMLNAIIYADPTKGEILGYKDIRDNEFWVAGHIPGRPLFPGVLMIEAAAQVASFYTKRIVGWEGFIGFGGVTDTKFRQQVPPGVRMHLVGLKTWERHGRIGCNVQGVVNGQITFETSVVGTQM